MNKYMQVVWLYLIGVVVILYGVIQVFAQAGPMSFVIMLAGLAISTIGAAHGRKMRQEGYGIEQFLQEKGAEQVAQAPAAEKEETGPPQEQQPPPEKQSLPEGPAMEEHRSGGLMGIFRRGASQGQPMGQEDILEIEMEDIRSGKLAPTEADVIELVCPRCNAENDEKNYFCFSCGYKLRRKPKDMKKKGDINVEPGSIALVGDKRVAKVLICPACNASNKERDRFCWKCGKKLRTEKAKKKPDLFKISRKR